MTRKGKPVPVLVNHAEYERLKETVDVLSDPVLMRQIRASRRYFVKGRRGLSFEDVFGEPIAPAKRRAPRSVGLAGGCQGRPSFLTGRRTQGAA